MLGGGIGLLARRLRQFQPHGVLSVSEKSPLALLEREGPTTCSALAKRQQITPRSLGVILAALESRGLIRRRPDPNDGRWVVMSLTRAGRDAVLRERDATMDLLMVTIL